MSDATWPANWPKEEVSVDFGSTINSIEFTHQVPAENGTFRKSSELLYSVKDRVRGGFVVAFCESDNVRVSETYGMVNISSRCSLEKTQDPVSFRADFRLNQNGYMETQVLSSSGDIVRSIRFSACK